MRVSNPPRFGINFNPSVPNPWSGGGAIHQWNGLSSFEPARNRHFDYATSGGADWFVNDGQAGMSYYDVWGDGYWAGADVRIYRLTDGKWNLLNKFPHLTTLALQMHNSLCPGDLVKVDSLGSDNPSPGNCHQAAEADQNLRHRQEGGGAESLGKGGG